MTRKECQNQLLCNITGQLIVHYASYLLFAEKLSYAANYSGQQGRTKQHETFHILHIMAANCVRHSSCNRKSTDHWEYYERETLDLVDRVGAGATQSDH